MTPDELKDEIGKVDAEAFCRLRLFGLESWLFDEAGLSEVTGTYVDFRKAVAIAGGVPDADVRLVGSSRFGVSMSPSKPFRPFHDGSDLDVVIVSSDLYSRIGTSFRAAYYEGYSWIKHRHAGDVFRRFVHLGHKKDYGTDYLRSTVVQLDGIARDVTLKTGLARDLRYRIYEDWDAAVEYHAYGVKKLQRMVSE